MHHERIRFRSVARTHVGLVRTSNEDAVLDCSEAGLWAVSDGMGGHAAGEVASTLVVDRLRALVRDVSNPPSVSAVRHALTQANTELYCRGALHSLDRTMGATITVLGADDTDLFGVWAGDSR